MCVCVCVGGGVVGDSMGSMIVQYTSVRWGTLVSMIVQHSFVKRRNFGIYDSTVYFRQKGNIIYDSTVYFRLKGNIGIYDSTVY